MRNHFLGPSLAYPQQISLYSSTHGARGRNRIEVQVPSVWLWEFMQITQDREEKAAKFSVLTINSQGFRMKKVNPINKISH